MRRFASVSPAKGGRTHMAFDLLLEGEKVACGLRMQPRWKFWYGAKKNKPPRCKRCLAVDKTQKR